VLLVLLLVNHKMETFFTDVMTFFNELLAFKNSGLYTFVSDLLVQLYFKLYGLVLNIKIFFMLIAWDIAKQMIVNMNISQYLSLAWGSIDSKVLNMATFFRIPESINILLSARITRYVMATLGI